MTQVALKNKYLNIKENRNFFSDEMSFLKLVVIEEMFFFHVV